MVEATRKELATALGVGVAAVDRARRLGRISYLPGRKRYDLEAARRAYFEGRDGAMVRSTAPGRPSQADTDESDVDAADPTTKAEADRRHAIARARLRELDVAQAEGRLIDAESAERAWYSTLRVVRDRILGVPARIASAIAAESDARRVAEIMDGELRQALSAASDEMPGSASTPEPDLKTEGEAA